MYMLPIMKERVKEGMTTSGLNGKSSVMATILMTVGKVNLQCLQMEILCTLLPIVQQHKTMIFSIQNVCLTELGGQLNLFMKLTHAEKTKVLSSIKTVKPFISYQVYLTIEKV